MTSSGNFLSKAILLSFAVLLCLPGLGTPKQIIKEETPLREQNVRIAVYPVENLSGTPAPLKEIRQDLIDRLKLKGVRILDGEALEKFMAKHRIRYTGGIDKDTAMAFKTDAGVDSVLITSLELYSESVPPKISLTSRLVSTRRRLIPLT